VPGHGDKKPVSGGRGHRRNPSTEARGGTAPGPAGAGRAGTAVGELVGLVGQGDSRRSGKAGTDPRR